MELRPLSLGEMLDRAVTVSVRGAVPLALIYLILMIPSAILQFSQAHENNNVFHELTQMAQTVLAGQGQTLNPEKIAGILKNAGSTRNGAEQWGLSLLSLLLSFLVTSAMIVSASGIYLRTPLDFGQSYRHALQRWLPMIGLSILYALASIVFSMLIGVAIGLVFVILMILSSILHGVGTIVGIVAISAIVLAAGFVFVLGFMAIEVSCFSCVLERQGPASAFASGISRVFNRRGMMRSFFAGLAFIVLNIGIIIVLIVGVVSMNELLHLDAATVAFKVIVEIVTSIFFTTFITIYYYDIRIRREGFDLRIQAQTANETPTATMT
ncbi:MAG TPA: hypothetical protein VGZ00_11380 [Candidatus Baltobacteraceae bacterium]|jgi:hypothetical protein|nr:hypothetical protein [Candidatus Baltobacteraceae bacterium]